MKTVEILSGGNYYGECDDYWYCFGNSRHSSFIYMEGKKEGQQMYRLPGRRLLQAKRMRKSEEERFREERG